MRRGCEMIGNTRVFVSFCSSFFIWKTLKYMKQLYADSGDIFIYLCKETVEILFFIPEIFFNPPPGEVQFYHGNHVLLRMERFKPVHRYQDFHISHSQKKWLSPYWKSNYLNVDTLTR